MCSRVTLPVGVGIGINGSKSLEEGLYPPTTISITFIQISYMYKSLKILFDWSSVQFQLKCDTIKVCFFFFVIIAGTNNLNK
jgi:hypothetical protein